MNSSFSSPYKNASFNSSATATSMTSSYSRRRYTNSEHLIMSEGSNHLLEHYGSQLPSMVKVVLNKVDDTQAVSLRLDPNGWAWLVWKRQLYIWRHVSDGKKNAIPCRELALPVSDLVHHARLVCVVGSGVVPSCIAVSPEGHISYWPNISNESSMVSVSADVTGQECDSLSSIWPTGCILATTSATVLLIKPIPGSKPSLSCSSLSHAATGWLGGLTKRMSFLMPMGGGPALETKRAKVAIPIARDDPAQPGLKNSTVYVLAGSLFQTWNVNSQQQNCLFDINVDDIVRKKFHEAVWDGKVDLRGIQIWLLDIISHSNSKISLLAAALDQSEANAVVNYGIFTFDPRTGNSRDKVELTVVDFTTAKSITDEEALYSWKLLVSQGFYYMMSPDRILIVSGSDECPLDAFSSEAVGGPFLGNGLVSEGVVVVFTPRFGLMSMRYNKNLDGTMGLNDSFAEVRVPDHLALSMTQHNIMDLSMSEDSVNRYKSAFLNFCGKRMDECQNILMDLFPTHVPSMTPNDPIDIWTVALCEKLIDDAPVSDPRWGSSMGREDGNDPMGLKSKMLIKNFLADKKKGLEIFFGFLKATGIWSRLTGVVLRNELEATASVLYNLYEKIGFAMALHFLQTEPRYRKYIDPAIKSIVAIRKENRTLAAAHLSFNDFFYKDVSRVHQFLTALVTVQEETIHDADPSVVLETVSENTEVLIVVFSELNQLQVSEKFGLIKNTFLLPLMEPPNKYDVIPWYIKTHSLEALMKQTEIILTASKLTEDPSAEIDFFKQLEQLTDLILDALKVNVESIKASTRYSDKFSEFETMRSKLIGNLVEMEPVGALSLAEKYLDFNILVSVCYNERDFERLELFFEKYYELEFPQYTFQWFLKQKKDSELIEIFSRSKYQALLGNFLKDYPTISWHHSTVIEDYKGASVTLSNLAKSEEVSVDDKKFMLCMAKLGILASGTTAQEGLPLYENVQKELAVIRYQNELPDAALEQYGLDRKTMRVLTPVQLIDIYTSDIPGLEADFVVVNYWKALCLCDHVGSYRDEKRLLVVARCIMRDPWDEWSIDHPEDVIESSLLFKFIMLGTANGEEVENLFKIDDLATLDILQHLFEKPNARYLLSAAYEHLCFQVRGNMSSS